MTFEQAIAKLENDRKAIEQAQSDLETVRGLYAIGEPVKATNLFASVRRTLRNTLADRETVLK